MEQRAEESREAAKKGARPSSWPITRACEFIDRSVKFSTLAGSLIQCIAALLNTASNSLSKSGALPFVTRTSRPSFPVASNCATLASTPMTWHPIEASFAVSAPSPHAMSKIRSPARGASSATRGRAKFGDEVGVASLAFRIHVCGYSI